MVDVITPIYTDLEKDGFHPYAGAGPGTNDSVYFDMDLMIGPHKVYFTYDEDPNQQAIICAKYPGSSLFPTKPKESSFSRDL